MTHLAWIHPQLIRPGDRMSPSEFLERWEQMPGLKFAELIDGVVYMPSPISLVHANWDGLIQSVCGMYRLRTPGTQMLTNSTWLMTATGAPQPDCSIRILPEFGGRSSERDGLASGAPEFVAEICHSSRAYDLGPKLALYQSAGVNEYLAVLVEERRFEWRILVNGSYELMQDDHGIHRSVILPGLWIDSTAFWSEDSDRVLQTLEQGLASHEHQDFVARLKQLHESANL
jgi:hypothetical protein